MAFWVKIKTAAEVLGLSIATLRNWDKQGKLEAKRDDHGHRLYSIRELEGLAAKAKIRRKKSPVLKLRLD